MHDICIVQCCDNEVHARRVLHRKRRAPERALLTGITITCTADCSLTIVYHLFIPVFSCEHVDCLSVAPFSKAIYNFQKLARFQHCISGYI